MKLEYLSKGASACLDLEMTKGNKRAWVDNLIYLAAGVVAVAALSVLVVLKIPFPLRGIMVALTTLVLGVNLVSYFRMKWRSLWFWSFFVVLMLLHGALIMVVLGHGVPIVFACLMMGPEFLAIGAILHWTTASAS
jgi:hypothetical protein